MKCFVIKNSAEINNENLKITELFSISQRLSTTPQSGIETTLFSVICINLIFSVNILDLNIQKY